MNRQILSNLSAKYEENYRNSYNLADEESYAARFYAAFTEAINSVMHQSEDSLEIGSDQAKIDVAILLAAQFDSKAYQARTVQQHNHFHEQFISFFNAVIDPILGLGLNITEPNKILTTNAALQNYITSFGFSENFSLSTKDAMISNLQQNIHTHRRVHDLAIYNRFIYNLNTPPSAIETIGLHLMTRRNVITPIQAVELEFNLDNLAERAFNIELSTFLLTLKAALTNRPLEQVLFNIPSEFFNDEKYAEQRAIFLEEFLPLVAELGPNIRFVFAGAQPSLLKEIEEKLAPLLESKKIDSALSFSNSIQSASGAYTTTTEQICLTANPKINNNFTDVTEAVSFLDENLIKTMIDDTVIQSLNKSLSSGMNHIVARNVLSQSPKTPLTMYQWVTDLIGSPALMQICEKWTPARWNPMWSSFSVLNKRTESTTQTKLNGRFANPGQMPNEESQTAVLHIADIETDLIKKPYPICIEMTQDQWVQGHKVVIDELKKKHQDPNNKIVLTKTGSMSKEIRITDSDGNDIAFPEQNNNIKKTIAHPLYVPEVKKIVLPESSLANKLGKCSPLNEDADNRISRANADKTEIIQHIDTNIEKLRTLVDARNAVFNQNHISTICTSLETRIVENHAHRQALKTIKEQSSSILKPSSTSLLSRALSDLESAYTAHYDDKAYDLAIKNAVENCTKYEKQLVSLRDDIQKNKLLENEPDFQSVITTLSDNITSFQEVNRSLSAFSSTDSEKIVNKSLFFKKEISATQTMIESCYELLNDTQPIDIARNTILKMVKNIDDRMEIETNRLLDITVLLEQYPRQTAKNISTENKNLTTFEQNWKTFRENPINDSTGVMAYINSTFTTLRNSLVDLTRSLKIATGGAVFFHQNSEYSQFSNAIKDVKTLLNSNKILNTPDIQLAIESLEKLDVASREYCDINPAIEPKTLTQLCDAHQDAIAKYTDYTPIVVKEAEGVPTLNVPEYQEYLVKNGDLDITIFQDFSIEAFQKLSQASIEKVCDKNSSDFKQDNPEFKNLLTREITYRNIVNNAMAFEIQIPKDKNDFLPHLTSCLASSQKLLSNLDIVRNSNTTTKESLDAILAAKSECLAYCEALNAFTAAIPGLPKSFEQHIADMKSFATELDSLEDGYDTSDLFLSLVQANTSLSISNIFDKITAFEEILKSPITLTDGVSITAKSAGENTGYAITVLEYAKVYTTLLEEFKKNSAKKINDSLHVLLNHGNEIIRSIRIQEAQTWDGFSKMLRGLSGYPTQSPLSVIQKIIGIITNESPFRFDFGLIDWERKASPDQNTITAIGTQIFSQVLNNVRSHPVMEASARKLSIRGVTKNYGAPLPYNHTVEYIDLSAFNNIEGLTSAATESLTDLAMQQCEMLTNDALTEFFYRMKQLGVHTIIVQKNLHDPLLALLKKSGIHLNILKEAVPVVPVKSICTDMSVLVLDANALSHELDIPSFENAYCISKINLQNEYTFSINSTLAEITKIYTSKKNEIDAQYLTYSQEYQTTITQTIETIIEEITAYYATTVQLSAVQNSALLCAMIQEKIETLVLKQSDKLPSAFGKHFAKALEQIIFPKIEATRVTSQYSLANWMNDITHATKESVSAYETHYRNASINFANAQMAIMNSENNLFNAEAIPELEISQEANEEEEDEEESEAINETNHNQDEDADQDENLNTQLDSLRGPTIWKLKAPTAFINDRAIKPLRLFSWSTWLKESLAFLINMQSIASPSCWNNKYAIFDATSFAQNLGISHTLLTYLSTTSRCLFNGTDKDLLLYQSNSLSAETYGRHSANNSIFNESNLIDLALIQQNTIYLPIAGDEILATMQGMPTNFSIDESLLATKADYLKTVQAGQITKDFHTTKSNENALQKIWDNALIDHVPYLFLSNLFSATAQNNPTNVVEKQIADLINTNNSLKHRSKLMYDLTLMIGAHADKNSNLNLVHRLELSWETLSKNNELLLKEFFSIPNNNTLPGSRIPEKYFTEFLHYYNQYLLNQVTTSGILPCPTPENLSIAITAFLSSTEKFLLQEAQKNYSQKIQNGAQIDLKGITQLLGNANKKAVSMFIKKYVFNMAGKSLSLIESGSLTQKLHAFYTTNKSLETKRHIIASQHVSATDLKLQRLVNDCRKIRPSLNESSFLIYLEHLDGKNFLAQDSIPSEMLLYPYENMFLDEFQEKQATLNSTNPGSTVKVENLDCAKTIREFWERYQVLATQSSIGKKSPICDLAENFQKLLNYYCDSKYCDLATFENYFNRLLTPIRYPFLMDACVRLGFVMNDFKSHNKDSIKNTLKNNLDNLSKLFGIFNEEERTEKQHVGQLSIIFELIEKCQKRIFDATDKKHTEEYLSLAHDITNTLKIIDDFTKQEINDFEDNTPTSFWENLLISIFGKNHPFQNSKKYNMIQKNYSQKFTSLIIALLAQCEKVGSTNSSTINIKDINSLVSSIAKLANSTTDKSHAALKNLLDNVRYLQSFSKDDLNTVRNTAILATQENLAMDDLLSNLIATQNNKKTAAQDASEKAARRVIENDRVIDPEDTKKRPRYEQLVDDIEFVNLPKELNESEDDIRALFKKSIKEIHDLINPTSGAILLSGPQWPNSLKEFNSRSIHSLSHDEKRSFIDKARHYLMTQQHHQGKNIGELMPLYLTLIAVIGTMMAQSSAKGLQFYPNAAQLIVILMQVISPRSYLQVGTGEGKTAISIITKLMHYSMGYRPNYLSTTPILTNQSYYEFSPLLSELNLSTSLYNGTAPTEDMERADTLTQSLDAILDNLSKDRDMDAWADNHSLIVDEADVPLFRLNISFKIAINHLEIKKSKDFSHKDLAIFYEIVNRFAATELSKENNLFSPQNMPHPSTSSAESCEEHHKKIARKLKNFSTHLIEKLRKKHEANTEDASVNNDPAIESHLSTLPELTRFQNKIEKFSDAVYFELVDAIQQVQMFVGHTHSNSSGSSDHPLLPGENKHYTLSEINVGGQKYIRAIPLVRGVPYEKLTFSYQAQQLLHAYLNNYIKENQALFAKRALTPSAFIDFPKMVQVMDTFATHFQKPLKEGRSTMITGTIGDDDEINQLLEFVNDDICIAKVPRYQQRHVAHK
ncbi:MAG: hypothetical protein FJ161_00410, partial [Gammaproteobacteria bacterium]|nr:hypothetical protein [Gammaproteobacteria bacterium]